MTHTKHTTKDTPPITAEQLAGAMQVSLSTVRRWEKDGCPVIHLGTHPWGKGARRRYRLADVTAWLEARNSTAKNTYVNQTTNPKNQKHVTY